MLSKEEREAVLAHPKDHDVQWPKYVTGIDGSRVSAGLSWTKIQAFEQCPRKYAELYLSKRFPYTDTPATLFGTAMHESLQSYVFAGKKIPKDIRERINIALVDAIAEKAKDPRNDVPAVGELKWAMTLNGSYTEYFGNGVFIRGQADLAYGRGDTIYVVDYKSGGGKVPKPEQVDYMAVLASAQPEFSGATKASGVLAFLETSKVVPRKVPSIDAVLPKIQTAACRIAECYQSQVFQEKQGPLCGWCEVEDCPFYSRR